jgi:hypothetical protein
MFKYQAICDVCGWKFEASMLRKRWDGFMVCEKDWEPRNILDFYRPRSDAHKLPWTRPESSNDGSWTPSVTGITGTYTLSASYIVDVNNVVTYRIVIVPTTATVGTSPTFSLPTGTVSTDRKGVALTSNGTRLGVVTAAATIVSPNFSLGISPQVSLTISGSYTKA